MVYLCPNVGYITANNWASLHITANNWASLVSKLILNLSSALNLMTNCQMNLLEMNLLTGSWTKNTENMFTLSIK